MEVEVGFELGVGTVEGLPTDRCTVLPSLHVISAVLTATLGSVQIHGRERSARCCGRGAFWDSRLGVSDLGEF